MINKTSFVVFLPFIFLISELALTSSLNKLKIIDYSISFFLCCVLSLIISSAYKTKIHLRKTKFDFNYFYMGFSLFFVSLSFYFITNNISSLSLQELFAFSVKYRYSQLQGTAIYTYYIINILPYLLSFKLIHKSLTSFDIALLVYVITYIIFLGLRIYLFPIAIACIIIFFQLSAKRKALLFLLSLLIFSLPKFISGSFSIDDPIVFVREFIGLFDRTNYSTLISTNPSIQFLRAEMIFSPEVYKEWYYHYNYIDFQKFYHAVGSRTGIAIPLPVIFFNSNRILFLLVTCIMISACIFLIHRIKHRNLILGFICFVFLIQILGLIVEDIFYFNSTFKIFSNLIFIFLFLSKLKKHSQKNSIVLTFN